MYYNPKYSQLYNDMLLTVLWSRSKVQLLNDEIMLASEAKKERFWTIAGIVSSLIQPHYDRQFKMLTKSGGIPLVFRSMALNCDLMGVHLVRRVLTTCDNEMVSLLSNRGGLVAGCVDPLQAFLSSQPTVLRDCRTIAMEIFGSISEELLSVSPERFIRMVVGTAAVRLTEAAAMGALDIMKPNTFDWQIADQAARAASRSSGFTSRKKVTRGLVFGVMRNAPLNDGEFRAIITFREPRCTLNVHVPEDVKLQDILAFAQKTYPDMQGMLRGIEYGLFWPENSRFVESADPASPDRRSDRLAAVGYSRACPSVNVLLDAIPLHDLVDQIDPVQARKTAERTIDTLNNIVYFDGRTDIVVDIPDCRGNFESRKFTMTPPKPQRTKIPAVQFKIKLTSVVALIKKHTTNRLDKHEWSFSHRVTNPGDNEIKFFRNIAKIAIKWSQESIL